MDNFAFHNPTRIIFGKGMRRADRRGDQRGGGIARVLLVAGGGSIRKNVGRMRPWPSP